MVTLFAMTMAQMDDDVRDSIEDSIGNSVEDSIGDSIGDSDVISNGKKCIVTYNRGCNSDPDCCSGICNKGRCAPGIKCSYLA